MMTNLNAFAIVAALSQAHETLSVSRCLRGVHPSIRSLLLRVVFRSSLSDTLDAEAAKNIVFRSLTMAVGWTLTGDKAARAHTLLGVFHQRPARAEHDWAAFCRLLPPSTSYSPSRGRGWGVWVSALLLVGSFIQQGARANLNGHVEWNLDPSYTATTRAMADVDDLFARAVDETKTNPYKADELRQQFPYYLKSGASHFIYTNEERTHVLKEFSVDEVLNAKVAAMLGEVSVSSDGAPVGARVTDVAYSARDRGRSKYYVVSEHLGTTKCTLTTETVRALESQLGIVVGDVDTELQRVANDNTRLVDGHCRVIDADHVKFMSYLDARLRHIESFLTSTYPL